MSKCKRWLLSVCPALLLALVLTGCGSEVSDPETGPGNTQDQPVAGVDDMAGFDGENPDGVIDTMETEMEAEARLQQEIMELQQSLQDVEQKYAELDEEIKIIDELLEETESGIEEKARELERLEGL